MSKFSRNAANMINRRLRGLPLVLAAAGFLGASGAPARAEPLADITDAARVVFDGGQEKRAKAATAGPADTLRDGSVGGQSLAFGSMDVSPALFSSLAYRGFATTWEWQQPQTVAAIDLFLPRDAPDRVEPLAIKVLGQAEGGAYVVRLFHTEDAQFKPAAEPRGADAKAGARHYRVSLHQPFTTRGIKVIAGAPGGRAGVGEMRVLAAKAAPAPAKLPPPIEAGKLVTWFGSPWTHTNGGTKPPTEAEKKAPWSLRMSQNDTEQAMIGLLNTGAQPASVEVSLQGVPKGMSAELLAVGAIEARGRKGGKPHTALMNLFTPAQVQAFHGFFPERFVRPQTWAKFPSLALPPGQPVYVWLRLSSRGERPSGAGREELAFVAKTKDGDERRAISVDVLKVTLPERPVVQSWTYGVVNDEIGRHHYNTVNGGYRYFTARNIGRYVDNAGDEAEDPAQPRDPQTLRKAVRLAADRVIAEAQRDGYSREQVIFVIYDEVRDAKAAAWVAAARELRAYIPDAVIIANPAPAHGGRKMTFEGTIKPIMPFVDVWEPHLDVINTMPEVVSAIKASGKPFWFYKNVGNHISRDEGAVTGFYRSAPWTVLKHDMQGACFWAASAWFGDMWNDFDRDRFRDWADAAVSFEDETHSAITTRNLEAWREGLEDVAIGRMLRAALDRGMLEGSDAAAARAWLGKAPDRVLQTNEKADGRPARDARDEALDILNRNWSDGANLPQAVEAPQALRS